MKEEKNQYEVQLLNNDPNALVSHYQGVVKIIVSKFVSRGFFPESEKMDVIQTINEALLGGKMDRIKKNYNGSVLLSTYFSKVVYNHCLEIARSNKKKPSLGSEELLQNTSDTGISIEQKLVLRDEVNRLQTILTGIIGLGLRLHLALKLYARIPLTKEDFKGALIVENDQYKAFKNRFFTTYDGLNDKEVYQKAVPFLNKLTSKNTDADSMRKWLNMQLDKIIRLQNGDPERSAHSRDTIRILLQMLFEEQKF